MLVDAAYALSPNLIGSHIRSVAQNSKQMELAPKVCACACVRVRVPDSVPMIRLSSLNLGISKHEDVIVQTKRCTHPKPEMKPIFTVAMLFMRFIFRYPDGMYNKM